MDPLLQTIGTILGTTLLHWFGGRKFQKKVLALLRSHGKRLRTIEDHLHIPRPRKAGNGKHQPELGIGESIYPASMSGKPKTEL